MWGPNKGVGDKKKQLDESILYSLDRPAGEISLGRLFWQSRQPRVPGDSRTRRRRLDGDAVGAWRRAARPAKDSTADASEALVSVWRTSAAASWVFDNWALQPEEALHGRPTAGARTVNVGSVVDAVA